VPNRRYGTNVESALLEGIRGILYSPTTSTVAILAAWVIAAAVLLRLAAIGTPVSETGPTDDAPQQLGRSTDDGPRQR
jgi:hypothetical protein